MAQRTRNFLFTGPFSNGQRPDENDFNDVWDSHINYQDDPINLDTTTGNFAFDNAIQLGDTADTTEGTIRFRAGAFEFRQGGAWQPLGGGGGGGAFQPVGGGPNVAFSGANVGIDTGNNPNPYKLNVDIGINTGQAERVRCGSVVLHNRQNTLSPTSAAYFSHESHANDDDFALSQTLAGEVFLNARSTQLLALRVGNNAATQVTLDQAGFLEVTGDAGKPGGGAWVNTSDKRTKKKVRSFGDGLDVLKKIKPIKFQFNGKAGTKNGAEHIGVLADDMKKIAPYMVSSRRTKLDAKDEKETDVLLYDSSALIYIAVNAIKTLSDKIDALEKKVNAKTS